MDEVTEKKTTKSLHLIKYVANFHFFHARIRLLK